MNKAEPCFLIMRLTTMHGTSNAAHTFPTISQEHLNVLNEIFHKFNGIYGCFVFVNFITFDHSKGTKILVCLTGLINRKSHSHAGSNIIEPPRGKTNNLHM